MLGGHGLEELERVVLAFGLVGLFVHLVRPEPREEVMFASTRGLHWSLRQLRAQPVWRFALVAVGGAGLAAVVQGLVAGAGGDDEKFALVRLGVPAAIAGAACGTLLLGLRRLEVVDAGTGAASGRSVGLILGAIVVAATSTTLIGAISSPEGAVLVGGVLLIYVGGRPLVSIVSNRLVEAGLIRDGVLPREPAALFERGESSGLLRPEVGGGHHFLHETFRRHLADRSGAVAPVGPAVPLVRDSAAVGLLTCASVTVALIGIGALVQDRSGLLPVDQFTDGLAVAGGDRLVLDSGAVIDVGGSVPRYTDEQARPGTYWTNGDTTLVGDTYGDPAELVVIGTGVQWSGTLPGRLVAADVSAESDVVAVTSRPEGATTWVLDPERAIWQPVAAGPGAPIDVVANPDQVMLLLQFGVVAISTGPLPAVTARLALPFECGGDPISGRGSDDHELLVPVTGGLFVRSPCSTRSFLVDDGLTGVLADFTIPGIVDANAQDGRVALLSSDGPTVYFLDRGERSLRSAHVEGMGGDHIYAGQVAVGDDEVWVVTTDTVGILPRSEGVVGRLRRLEFSEFVADGG